MTDTIKTGTASEPVVERGPQGDSLRITYSKTYEPGGARRAIVYVRPDGSVRVVTWGKPGSNG